MYFLTKGSAFRMGRGLFKELESEKNGGALYYRSLSMYYCWRFRRVRRVQARVIEGYSYQSLSLR